MTQERFKNLILVLIAVVSVMTAGVAFLQSDASNRDDHSGRDANSLAVEMLGQNVNGNSRSYYDYNEAYQTWNQLDVQAIAAEQNGDDAAAARYRRAAEQIRTLSPLLQAPYFDEATGEVDFARYEVDTYRAQVTRLGEEYTAAAGVKDAWDSKANTYVVHLTILAVSLFLLGLAAAIEHVGSQAIFTIVGSVLAVVAVVWAVAVYAQPVFDLRTQPAAIEAYTRGAGLAYENKDEEALAAFDEALKVYPDYAAVYVARGGANLRLSNFEAAVADFEQARAQGAETPSMLGDLAIAHFYLGQFDQAIALQQSVVQNSPDELWVQFDLGATQLISGQIEAARATYEGAMQAAIGQVEAAQQAGTTPSSGLWYGLNFGVIGLEEIYNLIASGEGTPDPALIPEPAAVSDTALALIQQIKELTVGLEYQGKAPTDSLSATISNFVFGVPVYADDGTVSFDVGDTFSSGVSEMSLLFDYEGLRDGQMVVVKVYIDGQEDPSWRIVRDWDGGASGSEYEIPLAISYTNAFILTSATYTVELYVDGHLANTGTFVVEE